MQLDHFLLANGAGKMDAVITHFASTIQQIDENGNFEPKWTNEDKTEVLQQIIPCGVRIYVPLDEFGKSHWAVTIGTEDILILADRIKELKDTVIKTPYFKDIDF